jgi:hypothetical protein
MPLASSNAPGRRCSNRFFEWDMTLALLLVGLILLWWPDSIAAGNLDFILFTFEPRELMAWCLFTGLVRAYVLFKNGRLGKWGPRLRAVMCCLGGLVWFEFAFALWIKLPAPSTAIGVYVALIVGELRSVLRSGQDADAH